MSKNLVLYFSRAGENYVGGRIVNLEVGNTKIASEIIADEVNGDLFEIKMKTPYSSNYMECIEEAKQDLRMNSRPELAEYIDSIDEYDVIYLGYPNYWGTMPMAVKTFLERYDFTGKIIKTFCTNEGSGMGSSEQDLEKLCTGATIKRGMSIEGGKVKHFEKQIRYWAKEV